MELCSSQGNLCRCLDSPEAQNISARGNAHVHCQCAICAGRAAYPMTAWRHMQRERAAATDEYCPLNNENVYSDNGGGGINNNNDGEDIGIDDDLDEDGGGDYIDDPAVGSGDDDDHHSNIGGDPVESGEEGDPVLPDLHEDEEVNEDEELDEDAVMKEFVLDAVLRLVEIKGEAGFSHKTLEELLTWGRNLHCANNEQLIPFWPSCWSEVLLLLESVGYKSPQLYWICLDESHPCLFGLMRAKTELCMHCGKEGTIPYYLSVIDKVKRWCSSPTMCRNITAHWREKSHWLPAQWKEGWGWPCKKEFWDGTRFSQLSYFWDPNAEWILPVRCPENGCGTVISADELLSSPVAGDQVDNTRLVECPSCQNIFRHVPQQVKGDPRNIAYDCKL